MIGYKKTQIFYKKILKITKCRVNSVAWQKQPKNTENYKANYIPINQKYKLEGQRK